MRMTAVVVMLGLTMTAAAGEPNKTSPTDAERARWTMGDMRSVATALEAYKVDNKSYPADCSNDSLRKLVEPLYIRALPVRDAWGNAFRVTCDGASYQIVSGGADGKLDEKSWESSGEQTDFAADAVLTNGGKFTRRWQHR